MKSFQHRLTAAACALLLLCTVGCKQASSNSDIDVDLIKNPNSAQGYNNDTAMPVMTFDCDLHDFGRLTSGESIAYSFHFRNTGNADLVINSCEASCGCTVADYPRHRIEPNGEGYITITFNSAGKSGQQYQDVAVVTNAQPARQKLKIVAQVTR